MVEVDVGIGPHLLLKLFTGDYSAGLLEQQREHAKRLLLQPHPPAVLAQLPRFEIHLEDAEAEDAGSLAVRWHGVRHYGSFLSRNSSNQFCTMRMRGGGASPILSTVTKRCPSNETS